MFTYSNSSFPDSLDILPPTTSSPSTLTNNFLPLTLLLPPLSATIDLRYLHDNNIHVKVNIPIFHNSVTPHFKNSSPLEILNGSLTGLLKASQDKKFVCDEAEESLRIMVELISPVQLLHKLRVYSSHNNPRVRDFDGMKEFGIGKLIQIGADLLNDRLPEAREAARKTVTSIYDVFVEDEKLKDYELSLKKSWENLCLSNLQTIQAQSLIKVIFT
ncbi:hypothetical protein MKX01_012572 [Papaver californicum]|nr:hypothetical protein MKX01_012572 [Papaver californicum]